MILFDILKTMYRLGRISAAIAICLAFGAFALWGFWFGSHGKIVSERDHTAVVESTSSRYVVVRFWDGRKVEVYANQKYAPGDSLVVVERSFANGDVDYHISPGFELVEE